MSGLASSTGSAAGTMWAEEPVLYDLIKCKYSRSLWQAPATSYSVNQPAKVTPD